MIFFTADTHFGHANIIRYCKRPFASAQAMDEALVSNWNAAVGPNDTVYHLGDFTMATAQRFQQYVQQLNGRICIVPGGHDRRWIRGFTGSTSRSGKPVSLLPPLTTETFLSGGTRRIVVMCHYAMRVWDRSHYGSWHLYGHSHGNLPPYGLSMDVGVDACSYAPVSLEQVVYKIDKLELAYHLSLKERRREAAEAVADAGLWR